MTHDSYLHLKQKTQIGVITKNVNTNYFERMSFTLKKNLPKPGTKSESSNSKNGSRS